VRTSGGYESRTESVGIHSLLRVLTMDHLKTFAMTAGAVVLTLAIIHWTVPKDWREKIGLV
jgi:hypothetical protein